MKKFFSLFLSAVLLAGMLSGCGATSSANAEQTQNKKSLHIVTTIFPEYDWVREVLGDQADDAEITFLLDNGVDMHSYQPSAQDIMNISTCDLFIYAGGESDAWAADAAKNATNKNMQVINLMDILGENAKEEEVVEGMQAEHGHDHEDDEDEHEEETEYDEHVWLSLKNAQIFVSAIADSLSKIDPTHADTYAANASAYNGKLAQLDTDYQAAVDAAPIHTVLFADRFPFRYLVDDYGLSYYAAFSGCSADTEASFDTIIFLANKVNELGLHSILTIENSKDKIANTIIQNTQSRDQQIRVLNSMQTVTTQDIASGTTYLSVMEDNLHVLSAALQ
jgi:zinc transport system substrate-binding protein